MSRNVDWENPKRAFLKILGEIEKQTRHCALPSGATHFLLELHTSFRCYTLPSSIVHFLQALRTWQVKGTLPYGTAHLPRKARNVSILHQISSKASAIVSSTSNKWVIDKYNIHLPPTIISYGVFKFIKNFVFFS